MCLVLFANRPERGRPFVLAANRDEAFARPAAPASWWTFEGVEVFGGRDLDKGGTWLGVTRAGRIAAVTNVRDGLRPPPAGVESRGRLVLEALTRPGPLRIERGRFPTFNLLAGELRGALFYARDDADQVRVEPGLHGLSNDRLDVPWPKVSRGLAGFTAAGAEGAPTGALFDLLTDEQRAAEGALPDTHVPIELERALSPAFIRIPELGYGTRCSTVISCDADGTVAFEERTFDTAGRVTQVIVERIETAK